MWAPLLLLCLCSGIASQNLDHRFFLMQIIEKYGQNGSITYEGFERLYKNLGLGETHSDHSHSHEHEYLGKNKPTDNSAVEIPENKSLLSRSGREIDSPVVKDRSEEELETLVDAHEEVTVIAPPNNTGESPKCLAPAQILAVYGVPRSSEGLSPVRFLHLCPAIIYQLDQHSCDSSKADISAEENIVLSHTNWLYAVLSILVISVSGFLIVGIIPLVHKAVIDQLNCFLVALAVGTLLGDAFIHLLPHALESHNHDEQHSHTDSIKKTGFMFLSVVSWFFVQTSVTWYKNMKAKEEIQENANYTPVNTTDNEMEKEMMQLGEEASPNFKVKGHSHSKSNSNSKSNSAIAMMMVSGDAIHNLIDGLAIGAAFSGGLAPGFATAVAVFTHELPHELGDFGVLLQSGMPVRKALMYNIVSSVLSLIGAIIGLFVGNIGDITRWIYAFTAGSFIYLALAILVPEMNKEKTSLSMIFVRLAGILCGGGLMCCIALYEHDMHNLFL
ncbi:zinc transporter ZIP10-like [Macrosteles quadrilineatus]|uniref:zinc transporter ZIP10-like n=1 Tax=Macrosteles quadrilineatus TaxID=74068 RepID=UPI0023E1E68B|nr:zinc transporter ZIP10-like [Macrosteles quadrilineatus]